MSYVKRDYSDKTAGLSCGCWWMIILANAILGGWSVEYLLYIFTHLANRIPWFWACVAGLFAGEVTMPVAVVVAILHAFKVL